VEQSDILSVFSGLRPLVTGSAAETSKLSREHHIEASPHGLITVAGGKWTTYRRMAEDAINFAAKSGMLEKRPCTTNTVLLRGATSVAITADPYLREYGSDVSQIQAWMEAEPELAEAIDAALPYTFAQVRYAVRFEMARTVEDILSRRTRALLLDAEAAARAAQRVGLAMAAELNRDETWIAQQVAAFLALQRTDYSLTGRG
jgi:glycerol-3-phosphate dehydrogenase